MSCQKLVISLSWFAVLFVRSIPNQDMTDQIILAHLLSARGSTSAMVDCAWKEFLRRFSNLFLKIIWQFEKDRDRVMEMYLEVCSRLASNHFHILQRYAAAQENAPTLATWLAAVVRNMCVDRYRAEHGRRRFPKALLRMSDLERRVFSLYYWSGASLEEIQHQIPKAESAAVILDRIEQSLFRPVAPFVNNSITHLSYDDNTHALNENRTDAAPIEVEDALNVLSTQERLVVRMRFWEDMSTEVIAGMTGIQPESRVETILRTALLKLREALVATSGDSVRSAVR